MYYCYHNSKGLDVYDMENAMDTVHCIFHLIYILTITY